jgi:putative copper export protein
MHWAAVSFLNASLAWMTGAFFVRIWLTGPEGTWTDQALRRLDTTFLIACIICGVCSGVNLWIAAAAMGDVPLLSASGAFQTMIISTNYGRFGPLSLSWKP